MDNTCSICLKDRNLEKNAIILECGHSFCLTCILTYKNTDDSVKTCPLCRGKSKIFNESFKQLEKEIHFKLVCDCYRETITALEAILMTQNLNEHDKVNITLKMLDMYRDNMEEVIEIDDEDDDDENF